MRRRLAIAVGLLSGILAIPAWAPAAQTGTMPDRDTRAKEQRIQGTVEKLDAAAHTFAVKIRAQVAERQVVYDDTTKITFRNKPAKVEELKEGVRVIVVGSPNEKKQLVARRIDIRAGS